MSMDNLLYNLTLRVRLFKAVITGKTKISDLNDREILFLEVLHTKKTTSIGELAKMYPTVSSGTMSTTITHLWKRKFVKKKKNPDNQRVTTVSLTPKGRSALEEIRKTQTIVFHTILTALNLKDNEKKVFENVLERAISFFDSKLGLNNETVA